MLDKIAKEMVRREKRTESTRKYRLKIREKKGEYIKKLGGVCSCCGEEFPSCCFDFHHINRAKYNPVKYKKIGKKVVKDRNINWYASEKDLAKELNKCELLCSNCHRIIHFYNKGGEA